MIRTIVGFHADAAGEWVAELSCLHRQHVRHRPPFRPRPWVLDPAGRAAHLGAPIDCPLCDRAELPDELVVVARLGPWEASCLPAGLRRAHVVPGGRWGRLHVTAGAVDFQFRPDDDPPGPVVHLRAPATQAIPPDVPHRVVVGAADRGTVGLELWGPTP